jgi:5'-nucleotidase
MAFLLDFEWNADFETMKPFIRKITLEVLENHPKSRIKCQFPKINKGQHQRNQNMSSSKSTLDRKFDKRQTPQEEITIGLPESL